MTCHVLAAFSPAFPTDGGRCVEVSMVSGRQEWWKICRQLAFVHGYKAARIISIIMIVVDRMEDEDNQKLDTPSMNHAPPPNTSLPFDHFQSQRL